MIAFIDDHRAIHGVESICKVLQIAPSGYYARLAVRADPTKGSMRRQTDAALRPKIQKVWDDNWRVYGVRKAWRQLCREGEAVAPLSADCVAIACRATVAPSRALWRVWVCGALSEERP